MLQCVKLVSCVKRVSPCRLSRQAAQPWRSAVVASTVGSGVSFVVACAAFFLGTGGAVCSWKVRRDGCEVSGGEYGCMQGGTGVQMAVLDGSAVAMLWDCVCRSYSSGYGNGRDRNDRRVSTAFRSFLFACAGTFAPFLRYPSWCPNSHALAARGCTCREISRPRDWGHSIDAAACSLLLP